MYITEWLTLDNDFVKKGQPIAQLRYLGMTSQLPSPKEGIFEIVKAPDILNQLQI